MDGDEAPVSASKELPKGGTVYAPSVAYVGTPGVTGVLWKKKTASRKLSVLSIRAPVLGLEVLNP